MNKGNAAQYLPLVQAVADGKEIQHNAFGTEWIVLHNPSFTESPERYRIKPEPREWWLVDVKPAVHGGVGIRYAICVKDNAEKMAIDTGGELIHVREVTP